MTAPSGAETTAAEETVTAPLRLVISTLPTPVTPAATLLPMVTVSPFKTTFPSAVESGLLTTSLLASRVRPACVLMSELTTIWASAAVAVSEICPRELGTAAIVKLPAVCLIEMPMSGLTFVGVPTLTFVTL